MEELYNKNFEDLTMREMKEAYERAKNAYKHMLIAQGKADNEDILKRMKDFFEDNKGLN